MIELATKQKLLPSNVLIATFMTGQERDKSNAVLKSTADCIFMLLITWDYEIALQIDLIRD